MASDTVSIKQKRKLISLLQDHINSLATDKFGSRLIDRLWDISDLKGKERMVKTIVDNERTVATNMFGRWVWRNCHAEQYKRRKDEWICKQKKANKAIELMSEIVEMKGAVGEPIHDKKIDDNEVFIEKKKKKKKRKYHEVESD